MKATLINICHTTIIIVFILDIGLSTNVQIINKTITNKNTSKYNSVIFQNIIPNYIQEIISSGQINQFNNTDELYKGLNQNCKIHLNEWINQLDTLRLSSELWALQMIDAWGKFPEGLLNGHSIILGDFDECLQIRANVNISGQLSNFKGRYCHSYITAVTTNVEEIPINFQVGTCYPSSCIKNDVITFHTNVLEVMQLPIISSNLNACYTDDAPNWTVGDIVMISVLGVIAALCIIGALIDVIYINYENFSQTHRSGFISQFVLAFSLYTNTKKWASTTVTKEDIGCIHGIRFFTTCWVIATHTWFMFYGETQPIWNIKDISSIHKNRWTLIPILNGNLSVDTFFTIGGLLVSYNLLKVLNKSGKFNPFKLYMHRYLRLTPAFALIIGITATWFAYLRTGPNWVAMDAWSSYCKKNWWQSLLYINNLWSFSYIGDDLMCHADSWYLAVDMQFFILAPLLIYPLWRWRRIGFSIMILVSVASIIIPCVITYELNLLPTMMPYSTPIQISEYTRHSYMKPWTRMGPYMVGLWTGYLLLKIRSKNFVNLPKSVILAGWCISTATALAIVFGLLPYYDAGSNIPNVSSAFYAGLHRFAWGMVIAWIIIACSLGYGGWINGFLSWRAFMPLGRISFCAYLISYQLQMLFHLSARQAVTYNIYTATNVFFSHVVMSYLVGFVCFITMETPFLTLDKLIFQEREAPNKTKTKEADLEFNSSAANKYS